MSQNTESIEETFERQETFLARYPRNVKMSVTAAIFALLILPPAWVHGRLHHHAGGSDNTASLGEMEEKQAASPGKKIETDVSAPALNDQNDRTVKLTPAPDERVTEDTAEGNLPRISEDGLHPWRVYARPFNVADKRPRIAIIVGGLGMSRSITDQAITQLPPTITLALDSQGPVVAAWGSRARQDGHEILLQVPMEPFDYPRSDPGPDTLLTQLPNADNLVRLFKVMRRATGYVGITTVMGSRFTTDSVKFAPVLQTLSDRGLMVLDSHVAPHSVVTDMAHFSDVPVATVTRWIDTDLSPDVITASLEDLEKTARENGRAVGMTMATPVMLTQLKAWAQALPQHGIALAPVSAMVQ